MVFAHLDKPDNSGTERTGGGGYSWAGRIRQMAGRAGRSGKDTGFVPYAPTLSVAAYKTRSALSGDSRLRHGLAGIKLNNCPNLPLQLTEETSPAGGSTLMTTSRCAV